MINKIKLFLGLAEANNKFSFGIYKVNNEIPPPISKLFSLHSSTTDYKKYIYYAKDMINNSKTIQPIKFSI